MLTKKRLFFGIGFFAVLLTTSPSIAHATITDGENASDALGQYDQTSFTDPVPVYTKGSANDAPNRFGFSTTNATAFDTTNHRLFVADNGNSRILVYNLNTDNTLTDYTPDNILGQTTFYSTSSSPSQSTFGRALDILYDSANNLLYATDFTNNRVLVFDVASITDGENAVHVLGQANFTSNSATVSQASTNGPTGLALDTTNHLLFVANSTSNRISVFDVASITDGENAVNVLGQTDFTSSSAGTTQSTLRSLNKIDYDAAHNRLFVADTSNSRVLVFDVASIADGENAVNVLGQTDFTSATFSASQSTMRTPYGVGYDATNDRLFVSDGSYNRVLVFDVASITDGENAVHVLGQANFTSSSTGVTLSRIGNTYSVKYDGTTDTILVADSTNHRVLFFDVSTITDGQNATNEIGQYDDNSVSPGPIYTKGTANNGPNKFGFNAPYGSVLDNTNHRLFISEPTNNRVLEYDLDSNNLLANRVPDHVLGQTNFYSKGASSTQSTFNSPHGLAYDGTNNLLYVADYNNNRVLIFDVTSITDGENAVNVLGQTIFTSSSSGTTQSKMWLPTGLAYDSTNHILYASNYSNRVLVFDVNSVTDGENAIHVLGQATFTSATAATTQSGMKNPAGITLDTTNNKLYVVESTNNRITVFDASVPDTTSPTLTEVTAVTTPSSTTTPSYTFSSSETGTISYGGSCTSSTTSALSGNNTITFSTLPDGTYSNCTVTVTDGSSNASSALSITTFTVSTTTSSSSSSSQGTGGEPAPLVAATTNIVAPSIQSTSSSKTSTTTVETSTPLTIRIKLPDADRVKTVRSKIAGTIYTFKRDTTDPNNPFFFARIVTTTPGTFPVKIIANYGSFSTITQLKPISVVTTSSPTPTESSAPVPSAQTTTPTPRRTQAPTKTASTPKVELFQQTPLTSLTPTPRPFFQASTIADTPTLTEKHRAIFAPFFSLVTNTATQIASSIFHFFHFR